jgi:hypothetical protein
MKSQKEYNLVRNLPVAKFYYQGSHSHPVRRTVLVIESNANYFRGFELREGSETRSFQKAPVKTYTRSKVALIGQCGRRLRKRTPAKLHHQVTLQRISYLQLVKEGI